MASMPMPSSATYLLRCWAGSPNLRPLVFAICAGKRQPGRTVVATSISGSSSTWSANGGREQASRVPVDGRKVLERWRVAGVGEISLTAAA